MLENMLVLLNSAAAVGVGPTPGAFAGYEEDEEDDEYRDRRPISSSKMPGSGKGLKKG